MSDPRSLQPAVNNLITHAEILHNVFLANYRDEANRPKLKTVFESSGYLVRQNLASLCKQPQLHSTLNKPNSDYNQFVSTWNNSTGVLLSSFNQLTEFWRSLETAKPELERLIAQPGPGPQPTPGHRGTPAEVAVFTRLRSETAELYKTFDAFVKHQPSATKARIQEHVRVITEQLNNSSLGHEAQTLLINSKTAWVKFTSQYKNGAEIDYPTLQLLGHFQTDADLACFKFLGS
jgi:hypothetical protein